MKEISNALKNTYVETANTLQGSDRRLFMARIVKSFGRGGQNFVEREFGWNRGTVRKGLHELESGLICLDNFAGRGRKRAEEHLPDLLSDIREIVDEQSQTDPTFRTTQLFTRLSAGEVRRQLIAQKGYTDAGLPCEVTINSKLNEMGYRLRAVEKSKPQKKSPKQMPSLLN